MWGDDGGGVNLSKFNNLASNTKALDMHMDIFYPL